MAGPCSFSPNRISVGAEQPMWVMVRSAVATTCTLPLTAGLFTSLFELFGILYKGLWANRVQGSFDPKEPAPTGPDPAPEDDYLDRDFLPDHFAQQLRLQVEAHAHRGTYTTPRITAVLQEGQQGAQTWPRFTNEAVEQATPVALLGQQLQPPLQRDPLLQVARTVDNVGIVARLPGNPLAEELEAEGKGAGGIVDDEGGSHDDAELLIKPGPSKSSGGGAFGSAAGGTAATAALGNGADNWWDAAPRTSSRGTIA